MSETESEINGAMQKTTLKSSKSRLIDSVINIVLKVLIIAYIITWFVALT